MKLRPNLLDERGLKWVLAEIFICWRKGHEWRNAGDWFICTKCERLTHRKVFDVKASMQIVNPPLYGFLGQRRSTPAEEPTDERD